MMKFPSKLALVHLLAAVTLFEFRAPKGIKLKFEKFNQG
jgi:hypothetical protein